MGILGFIPFSGSRDHGGGGMSFDPEDPDYGVPYHDGVRNRERDVSPSGLLDDWKYLLSGQWIGDGLDDFADNVLPGLLDRLQDGAPDGLIDKGNSPKPGAPLNEETIDYLNAEIAKYYGMDRNTAYQEALSNTAYQRAVMDMQRAGLNPAAIFGAGRGQGASGVSYVSSGSSSYSGSAKNSKLFSSEDFGLIASLSGLATAVVTKKPSNFWLGQQGAQAVMQVLNGLDRKFK